MNPKEIFVAFETIIRKEITRFTRIWTQTLLPPVITQSLYFVIFGKFIGARVGMIEHVSYMSFIIPGLVMMAVISSSFTNVVSSFFSSKFQRSIEELIVSPTPNWVIVAGYIGGGTLRGILVGILVFGVSIFFERPQIQHGFLIALFIILTAVVFSLGGLVNGIFAKKFDDVAIFPTFVLTPLTYLGGVFYSIHSLPGIWQKISYLNPIMYMVNGFRYGFFGISDVNVYLSLSLLTGLAISLILLSLYLLEKGTGIRN